jgi:enolase
MEPITDVASTLNARSTIADLAIATNCGKIKTGSLGFGHDRLS